MNYNMLFLQVITYAANNVNSGDNKNIVENEKCDVKTLDEANLCKYAEKIVHDNKKKSQIYQNIVDALQYKYEIKNEPNFYRNANQEKLYDNYQESDIKNIFNTITNANKEKVDGDSFFDFHYKILYESAIFSLDKMARLKNIHKEQAGEKKKIRAKLEANPMLFIHYLISFNWLKKQTITTYDACLIYNYDNYDDSDEYYSTSMFKNIYKSIVNFSDTDHDIMNNFVEQIKKYFKNKDFTSIQKITENENTQELKNFLSDKNITKSGFRLHNLIQITNMCIFSERSSQTKIKYISKPNYATKDKKKARKYPKLEEHKEFIKNIQLETVHENFYNISFNSLIMHNPETIKEGLNLTTALQENIDRLIMFTESINQFLFDNIKKNIKR
ncbi:hypothetical protein BDAP_001663 [Binucleata daphniae]